MDWEALDTRQKKEQDGGVDWAARDLSGASQQMPTMAAHEQPGALPSHGAEPVVNTGFASDFFTEQGITPESAAGSVGDRTGMIDLPTSISNIPSNVVSLGGDVKTLVTEFPQIIEGVKALASGLYETATTGEESPIIAQVRKAAMEKYGSFDKFTKAFEDEPLDTSMLIGGILGLTGAAMRTAGGVGKVGVLSDTGKTLTRAGTALDLPTQAVKLGAKVAAKPARSMMESATKLGTTIDKATRNKFFDVMFKHNIMPTGEGMKKVEGLISGYNKQIDDLISAAETSGSMINKNDVLASVTDMLSDVWKSGDPIADSARILKVIEKYDKAWPTQITPSQAQQIKQNIYKSVHFDKRPGRIAKPQYTEAAMKEAAKALKEELEIIPGLENIKYLNADEGVLIDLVKPLTRAMNRVEQRDFVSMGHLIKGGVGGGIGGALDASFGLGGVGMGTGFVLGIISSSPKLQAKLALVLKRAQKAAAKAQTGGAVGLAEQSIEPLTELQP